MSAPRILGVNSRTYPTQGRDGGWDPEGSTILVVLVAGTIGDYAAYAGSGTPEWVARYGVKLSYAEACVHFPNQLEPERYRAA